MLVHSRSSIIAEWISRSRGQVSRFYWDRVLAWSRHGNSNGLDHECGKDQHRHMFWTPLLLCNLWGPLPVSWISLGLSSSVSWPVRWVLYTIADCQLELLGKCMGSVSDQIKKRHPGSHRPPLPHDIITSNFPPILREIPYTPASILLTKESKGW